jgi:hypothetical protein
MLLAGGVELVNGLHRWVVAGELGIDVVPVAVSVEPGEIEPSWAWESDLFSWPRAFTQFRSLLASPCSILDRWAETLMDLTMTA